MSQAGDEAGAGPARARRAVRVAFQVGGFVVGIGLLAWCVRAALSPENRAQLTHFREAPAGLIGAVLGLSAISIVLNGLIFWATLSPVRRLRRGDVIAVNALATFLNYAPFKLSVIARVLIHNRRDGVPVFVIGGWFAAMGAVLAAALAPVAGATALTHRVNAEWLAAALAGVAGAIFLTVLLARVFGGARGLERLTAMVDALRVRPLSLLIRSRLSSDFHTSLTMLASPAAVTLAVVLRLTDMVVQGARFVILAGILGWELGLDEAFLYSVSFFVIGVLSPVGMTGFREWGTAGVAAFAGVADPKAFVVVPLLVGAVEAVVNLTGAGAGFLWLRLARRPAPAETLNGPGSV